ncbi:hypothetical protein [Paenibacillus maysiensis]|uniref:hypothetical protein n=1 Tax=Paenibacillus maysiensis TaxID=1155954 RepID=UPI0004BA273A|nr:hypothetical protein [Paenibacillus maysiensis]
MSKRATGWTEDKIAKYLKEGKGQGEGKHYKPWLSIQDVPSSGRSHRSRGARLIEFTIFYRIWNVTTFTS